MSDRVLEVDGMETCYGLSQVLHGLSLSIKPSEMVTLMGRNGMGKTTTVRSIMGLTPARAGTIKFMGAEIRGLPSYKVAQLGIGLVPEGRQIFPNLSVRTCWPPRSHARAAGRLSACTTCFRGWRNALTAWATSCRAASSRCWR